MLSACTMLKDTLSMLATVNNDCSHRSWAGKAFLDFLILEFLKRCSINCGREDWSSHSNKGVLGVCRAKHCSRTFIIVKIRTARSMHRLRSSWEAFRLTEGLLICSSIFCRIAGRWILRESFELGSPSDPETERILTTEASSVWSPTTKAYAAWISNGRRA